MTHTTAPTSAARRIAGYVPTLFALALLVLPFAAGAQTSRTGEREFRWNKALPSGSWVRLHNVLGSVTVTATDGERVEVVATRRGSSADTEARVEVAEWSGGVSVCALHTSDAYCDERGAHSEGSDRGRRRRSRDHDDHAYYDFEVRVPRRHRVVASTVTGDVHVTGTTLEMRAASVSGDVRLDRVRAADRLSATSVSGSVTTQLDAVAAGTEMTFTSVSGDVSVTMPQSTGVDLTMSTVSGELRSDFQLAMKGRFSQRRINATIGGGGSPMRVSTVSGDVRLAAR